MEVVGGLKIVGTFDGTDEGLAVALLVGTLVGANEGGGLAGAGVVSWRRAGNDVVVVGGSRSEKQLKSKVK